MTKVSCSCSIPPSRRFPAAPAFCSTDDTLPARFAKNRAQHRVLAPRHRQRYAIGEIDQGFIFWFEVKINFCFSIYARTCVVNVQENHLYNRIYTAKMEIMYIPNINVYLHHLLWCYLLLPIVNSNMYPI